VIRIIIMIVAAVSVVAVARQITVGDPGLWTCSCPDDCTLHMTEGASDV
jgi:hypothetical protein